MSLERALSSLFSWRLRMLIHNIWNLVAVYSSRRLMHIAVDPLLQAPAGALRGSLVGPTSQSDARCSGLSFADVCAVLGHAQLWLSCGGWHQGAPSSCVGYVNRELAVHDSRVCLSYPRHPHHQGYTQLATAPKVSGLKQKHQLPSSPAAVFSPSTWRRKDSRQGTAALVVAVSRSSLSPTSPRLAELRL